jgi:hypothetical protein
MDLERYYELRAILQQWRMRLAESIRRRVEDSARWLNCLRLIYEGSRRTRSTKSVKEIRSATNRFVLRALRPLRVFVIQTPF